MLTGQQYKDSLKDGRRVYFEGEPVEDLESVPEPAVPLNAVAAGYDKYFSAEPGAVNPVTTAPTSPEELRDRIPIITEWTCSPTPPTIPAVATCGTIRSRPR